ncbi:MAG: type II toxin-antitoxin system RelE/ParE family toxin [Tannerellaceae bacterium]|nr:type II toxin-antitoxin system RelE/ParE family toxin [Tannerellaceae bacterium]
MKVVWEKEASNTLTDIYNYHKGISERVAKEFYTDIVTETKRLENFPQLAQIEPLLIDEPEKYRSAIVRHHYKLVYFIDEEKQEVVIVRLWDCRQDPATHRIQH